MKSVILFWTVALCALVAITNAVPVEVDVEGDKEGSKVDVAVDVPKRDKGSRIDEVHGILKEHLNRPVFVGVDIPSIFNFKFLKSPKGDGDNSGVGVNVDIPFLKNFQEGMKSVFKQKGDLDYEP